MLQFQLFAPKTTNDYRKCQFTVCRDVKLLKRANKMVWFIALTHHCSIIDVYSHVRTNDNRDIKIHLFRGMNCVNWICNCLLTPHSAFWSSRITYLNKSPEIIWRLVLECFKLVKISEVASMPKINLFFKEKDKQFGNRNLLFLPE